MPGGVFVMDEPRLSSSLEDNIGNPMAPFTYAVSTLHCLTASLAVGGAGLGTAWGEQVARRMLAEAGFGDVVGARRRRRSGQRRVRHLPTGGARRPPARFPDPKPGRGLRYCPIMPDAAVLTEVRDRVLLITLNRPEAMNAVNAELASACSTRSPGSTATMR